MLLTNRKFSGFSLVELSIVLVILGLLTGGILAGQSLIRAAELRSLTADADRYAAAANTFRDKYLALPGDMTNAEQFWGAWSTAGTPSSVVGAKNGNGDGFYGSPIPQYERVQFFRHLALAGLIEGSYAGSYAEPADVYEAGVNIPRLKIGNGRAIVNGYPATSGIRIYGSIGNYLILQGSGADFSLLTPQEAWNIDTKRDDGNPSTGGVFGIAEGPLGSRTCTTNDDWVAAPAGSATYRLEITTVSCWPLIWFR